MSHEWIYFFLVILLGSFIFPFGECLINFLFIMLSSWFLIFYPEIYKMLYFLFFVIVQVIYWAYAKSLNEHCVNENIFSLYDIIDTSDRSCLFILESKKGLLLFLCSFLCLCKYGFIYCFMVGLLSILCDNL